MMRLGNSSPTASALFVLRSYLWSKSSGSPENPNRHCTRAKEERDRESCLWWKMPDVNAVDEHYFLK